MRILVTGISTRALAGSAARSGYPFLTLDYFGDFDQQVLCENYSLRRDFGQEYGPAQLWQASRRLTYDALVYTASLENHPLWVERLAAGEGRQLLGNGPAALRRARHWPTFFTVCERLGCPGPLTLPAGQPAAAGTASGWLRKPVQSGGGHDVGWWPAGRIPGRGFFLQAYVPGRVCSAAFLAAGRKTYLLGMSEQIIGLAGLGARDFTYCGNIFPLALPSGKEAGVLEQVRRLVEGLAAEFELVGLNGLDFILDDRQIYPLEINPRYTASMELIERGTGIGMFAEHVQACRAQLAGQALPDLSGARAPAGFHGKAILYAERDCRAPDTRGWVERGVRDVPHPGEEIPAGSPVCTVLASASSGEACREALLALTENLKGELYA